MRRLIALLILCLLPLQWSYAAVAEYCQHEEEVAAQNHFGHHTHKHVDKSGEGKDQKKNGIGDWDCPSCQHSTAVAIPAVSAAPLPNNTSAPVFLLHQRFPDRSPDNPFRPPLIAGL